MGGSIALLLLVVLISALCSGLEIALVSSNKLYIELQRKQGAIWARLVSGLLKRPERVISALLVGNTVALVAYGILMAGLLEPGLRAIGSNELFVLIAQTVLSTMLILVAGEYLPKAIFRIDPDGMLAVFAVPLRLLYALLWLPTMLLTTLSKAIMGLFGVRSVLGKVGFGRIDLNNFLQDFSEAHASDDSVDAEVEYFRNTLELSNIKVREVMVPRAEIEAIDVEDPISELGQRFLSTGLSKLLVHKGGIDEIIGYVHSYEMFRKPRSIRAVMRPVNFIPGTMPADEVLRLFTKERTHMAVVVDEFGGTAGMLTIEDVVETIVGEIEDEHDEEHTVEERLSPTEFVLSARLDVEYLKEEYGLDLPEDPDYDTMAGFIMHHTGTVPDPGSIVEAGPFRITVTHVSHGRIDLLNLVVTDVEHGFINGAAHG